MQVKNPLKVEIDNFGGLVARRGEAEFRLVPDGRVIRTTNSAPDKNGFRTPHRSRVEGRIAQQVREVILAHKKNPEGA